MLVQELVPPSENTIIYRGVYHLKETNFSAKKSVQSPHAQANTNCHQRPKRLKRTAAMKTGQLKRRVLEEPADVGGPCQESFRNTPESVEIWRSAFRLKSTMPSRLINAGFSKKSTTS